MSPRLNHAERVAIARARVDEGRRIVRRQREMIATHTADGKDIEEAQRLLDTFERSLVILEDDLDELLMNGRS